ncbi:MAG: Ig-like domain-containing protein [Dysgonamonadaceae bacterium]|jgi:uncharacterized protein YjdB|nr:Ig-like domain-containing protein [Dysgonamonadaceae bacterium]
MKKKSYILTACFIATLVLLYASCSEKQEETPVNVESISFIDVPNDTVKMIKGDVYKLRIATNPPNSPVRFYNASSEAFSVKQNTGEITALKGGAGTVIVIAQNGDSWTKAYCKVVVTELVEEITVKPYMNIQILSSGTLNVSSYFTALPVAATNKTLTYASSNPAVASVDAATGLVKMVSKGVAEITAVSADGGNVKSEPVYVYSGYNPTTYSHGSGSTAWIASMSSTYSSSYGASRAIDNNTNNFCHWSEGESHPHYLQIDFKQALKFNEVQIYRRPNYTDTRDVEIYIIPSTVTTEDDITWTDTRYEKWGEISFGDEASSVTNKAFRKSPGSEVATRYLMLKLPNGNRYNSQSLAEVIPVYNN